MLSVKDAQTRINSLFHLLESTQIPLKDGLGRILSETIYSDFDFPLFDNSSVDGFALIAEDIAYADQENPVYLNVIADIPAGTISTLGLSHGQAARIMTGAPLPAGANAVVMIEDTSSNSDPVGNSAPKIIGIFTSAKKGENIRVTGDDVRNGQDILPSGSVIRSQDIGLLAMMGKKVLPVRQKPRVAIFCSGDELIPVDIPLSPGKIYESNTYMLTSLAVAAGCDVINLGVATDSIESIKNILNRAVSENPDFILSSAGVSKGAYDFVKDVVESSGVLNFWKVNMRPGKPLAFGQYENIPFLGLPGNPVASFVSFLVFINPIIEIMTGTIIPGQHRVKVILSEEINSDGRESYLRGFVKKQDGKYSAKLTGHQGSGNLFSLVQANALLIIPSGVKSCPPGSEVEAWILEK